jgi:epoxyqueuosine reductase QueG
MAKGLFNVWRRLYQSRGKGMVNELNSETVKGYGLSAGASVVGIASSKDFHLAPEGFRPTDVLEGCLSIIVLGSAFPKEAILNDPKGYIDIRNAVNERMNDIEKDVAKRIRKEGYKVKTVSGLGGKWVDGRQRGHISLKHAAELAGLGVIGRNYLLINKRYGTLLWLGAVLTDAELAPDERARNDICNDCNKCVEMCPSKALGNPDSFGKEECIGTMFKMVDRKWEINCYLCRKVCPHRFGELDRDLTTVNVSVRDQPVRIQQKLKYV